MFFFFFFNDTATTEIYTLSLHDALPIFFCEVSDVGLPKAGDEAAFGLEGPVLAAEVGAEDVDVARTLVRSEEHTSELQSRQYLVCRLLLEKKKLLYLI